MPDAPDGTLIVEIGITLGQSSIPPSSTSQLAIVALNRLTTSSGTYGTVVSYTVPAASTFELEAIEVICDDYDNLQLQLTIAGVVQFTDKYILGPFNPSFGGANLVAGAVVLLEAKSDGSASIKVDGAIEGKVVS